MKFKLVGLLFCVMMLCSCTGRITEQTKLHMINIAKDGNAYPVLVGDYTSIVDGVDNKKLDTLSLDYDRHVSDVIENIIKEDKKQLLIFVHGGLNSFEESIDRVEKDLARMKADDVYAVFINWRSGGLTTYSSHLSEIRNAEYSGSGLITSPVYFTSDLIGGIAKAPIAWLQQGEFALKDLFKPSEDNVCLFEDQNFKGHLSCLKNAERPTLVAIGSAAWWLTTAIPKVITTPFVYSFGKPAWDVMNRRVKTTLFRSCEFSNQCDVTNGLSLTGLGNNKSNPISVKTDFISSPCMARLKDAKGVEGSGNRQDICSGALSVFINKLADRLCSDGLATNGKCIKKNKTLQIDLIGHSMGTIVIGELLKSHSYMQFDNIVFMGAAIRGREAIYSLDNYMRKYQQTKFYNLSLHPTNETTESSFGILPSGSLLEWIDSMYGLPETEFDLTFGRWENARKQVSQFSPDVAYRMYFKVFGFNTSINEPQEHGDFDDIDYWKKLTWFDGGDQGLQAFPLTIKAQALSQTGHTDQAMALRQQLIDGGSENPVVFADQAKAHLNQGQPALALEVLAIAEQRRATNEVTHSIKTTALRLLPK